MSKSKVFEPLVALQSLSLRARLFAANSASVSVNKDFWIATKMLDAWQLTATFSEIEGMKKKKTIRMNVIIVESSDPAEQWFLLHFTWIFIINFERHLVIPDSQISNSKIGDSNWWNRLVSPRSSPLRHLAIVGFKDLFPIECQDQSRSESILLYYALRSVLKTRTTCIFSINRRQKYNQL